MSTCGLGSRSPIEDRAGNHSSILVFKTGGRIGPHSSSSLSNAQHFRPFDVNPEGRPAAENAPLYEWKSLIPIEENGRVFTATYSSPVLSPDCHDP